MANKLLYILLTLFFYYSLAASAEPLVVTHRPAIDEKDNRYEYEKQVMQLALEKTQDKYGAYVLEKGVGMNLPRALHSAKQNTFKNFFFKTSYSSDFAKDLLYVPIPVDGGIVGVRVCFTSEALLDKISKMQTLEEIRTLTIGQGKSWNDVKIFRHNNFKVEEVLEFKNLFPMVAASRFELFCRGANEIKSEWEEYGSTKGLAIEKSFALAYNLPRFLWTNKQNVAAAKRLEEGLKVAHQDGSLKKLWESFNQEAVQFVTLGERRFFWLENPQLEGIAPNYENYFYYKRPN